MLEVVMSRFLVTFSGTILTADGRVDLESATALAQPDSIPA
jgi:hypothetical protein